MNKKLNSLVVAISAAVILLPLGYSVVCSAFSLVGASPEPFLQTPDKKYGEKCITGIDPTYMRFRHMDLLKGVRDEAVREGRRGEIRLNDCWECHANPQRRTSREAFCDRCHSAVNLHLNCFGCHHDPDAP